MIISIFQILCKFVCACLEQANSDSFHHIAFPALGTGSLKFPLEVTAKVMIKCITEHETNFHDSTLKDISIVVFDGDKNCQSVKSVCITFFVLQKLSFVKLRKVG